jgi:hypothetical protein
VLVRCPEQAARMLQISVRGTTARSSDLRGSAAAARNYAEADRFRVDDYYLAEATGPAQTLVAGSSGVQ